MKKLKLNYRLNAGNVQMLINYGYKEVSGDKTKYKPLILVTGQKDSIGNTFDCVTGRFNKSNPDFKNFNLALTKTETKINELFAKFEYEGREYSSIPPEQIKELLIEKEKVTPVLPTNTSKNQNLLIIMQEYVDSLKQMGKLDKMTIKSYQNFLNILNTYLNGKPLYESNLTLKFHADFFNYLTKQGLKNNTLWKIQKVLRTIFRYLKSQDIKIGYDYLSAQIRVSYKTPDTIALTFSELKMIHEHNSKKAPLNRVKHLFLFQCCTGVRYSDINKFVKMSDCILQSGEKYKCFKIETEKTGAEVTIPVVSLADEIYNLYKGQLPELSNQKYNQYLKEFLNEINYFNEVRKKYVFENKQKTLVEYTIGEQVSTHTARRTFATIMFNLGCPVRSIMKITGHIQLETFFSYIKLNADDNEQMITIKNKFEENWNLQS